MSSGTQPILLVVVTLYSKSVETLAPYKMHFHSLCYKKSTIGPFENPKGINICNDNSFECDVKDFVIFLVMH